MIVSLAFVSYLCFCYVNIRYLTAFMSEKGNLAAAYKLLGQIQEMQQQPALEAYKRSLELDSTQNDVLLKGITVYVNCLAGSVT